jgi:hypothetical protein
MDFEEQVSAALNDVPPELAAALENVAIVIEEEDPEEPDVFGWYDGLGPGRDRAGALPDKIVLYRARSGSPSSTRSGTSSVSTRIGFAIWATASYSGGFGCQSMKAASPSAITNRRRVCSSISMTYSPTYCPVWSTSGIENATISPSGRHSTSIAGEPP